MFYVTDKCKVYLLVVSCVFCADGELRQVIEDCPCLLEIPKGTAELGLRVTAVPEMKGVSENVSILLHRVM